MLLLPLASAAPAFAGVVPVLFAEPCCFGGDCALVVGRGSSLLARALSLVVALFFFPFVALLLLLPAAVLPLFVAVAMLLFVAAASLPLFVGPLPLFVTPAPLFAVAVLLFVVVAAPLFTAAPPWDVGDRAIRRTTTRPNLMCGNNQAFRNNKLDEVLL